MQSFGRLFILNHGSDILSQPSAAHIAHICTSAMPTIISMNLPKFNLVSSEKDPTQYEEGAALSGLDSFLYT